MTKYIYKYQVMPGIRQETMPKGAEILTVQMQGKNACIWALVDPAAPPEERTFFTVTTGQGLENPEKLQYIGTIQVEHGMLVYHVFEII